ncbi:DUF1569 domain-containing protein [Mucilaginibacter sp. Bleaf8]|uniref:DUF1569 domain-containing protein n=1 Tax=Mucilaginibacter sp. Bleaf8 TaxID=2834430 RepID=UPI001BCCE2A9|nr:DUF1569 domain-containing protein [Mucilaginibacter sp. Bleaf8]MBS7564972.1 DUF1569 domain-containing protein [Mucilaginibacter sp. Bleaf8]
MKSLYQPATLQEISQRLQSLRPDSQRQWGKMNAAQMMAHCTAALQVATAHKFPPRMFVGYILGPFLRPIFSNEKPFFKNTATDKSFLVNDQRSFEMEKKKLLQVITQFHEGGETRCTSHPHPFFGSVTPAEWGTGMYKHLDHHLRQFGL